MSCSKTKVDQPQERNSPYFNSINIPGDESRTNKEILQEQCLTQKKQKKAVSTCPYGLIQGQL